MKVKLLVTVSLFAYQFSFSQNEELIIGKVFNQNRPIPDVDVINFNTKEQTTTNQFGNFSITAKTNDLLVFTSKTYELKKIIVNQKHYDKNNFFVYLNLKPEELEEVVITKMPTIKLSNDKSYEQEKLQKIAIEKAATRPQTGIYDGRIANGANILGIASMILDILGKEKEPRKEPAPKIEFIALAKNTCDQIFFTEKLKLKPDQIDLFLQFCETDPHSKNLIKNHNILSMMDFLSAKNIEFQKLQSFEK